MADPGGHPRVAADVAVFAYLNGAMHVLLVRRRYEPYESYWALPGGGIEATETLEEAAVRELREETGVVDTFMEQLATFSEVGRDPRGRVISCCYLALVDAARVQLRPGSDAREAAWRPLEPLLQDMEGTRVLAFDHDDILRYARQRLAYKLEYQNVAWGLLPDAFTMSELRHVYEAGIGRAFEPNNFRRIALGWGVLAEDGERATGGRPAALYRFADRRPLILAQSARYRRSGLIAAAPTELLVDEYELTMADSYVAEGKDSEPVAFELFARELPPHRGYLVAAGLERAVEVLTGLRFGDPALEYLERARICSPALLARLATVEFTGDLAAVPEGTVVHAREPILRVEGDLLTCQLVETLLLNQVNFQTLIATKASRIVAAADGRPVVDFGFRRAHGADAGLLAARAAYIGGCAATATVAAGYLYGVPTTGTMAHSYILSFPTDVEAFVAFLRHHPERSTLLIDTRDTVAGAHAAVEASRVPPASCPGLSGSTPVTSSP